MAFHGTTLELTQFLNKNNIDIILLVETHLTNKNNFQIRVCSFYRTDHPDGKAHGGTGILIRERIKHDFHQRFATNYLKATSIKVQSGNGNLTMAAVYCPPRFTISEGQFMDFYNLLGHRFIATEDSNRQTHALGITPCHSQRKAIIQCNHKTEQQIRQNKSAN